MTYILAAICILSMVLSFFLIFLSLPGVWLILLLAGVWSFFSSSPELSFSFFLLWGSIALTGEAIEFAAGYYGSKLFGGSSKGSLGGIVGAILGAILGAPFLFGLGAFLGALAGGYTLCLIMEMIHGKTFIEARRSALGVTLGRLIGFIIKLSIGAALLWKTIPIILHNTY